jgi:hypothetical protein
MGMFYHIKRMQAANQKKWLDKVAQYLEPDEVIEHHVHGKVGHGDFAPRCVLVLTNKKLIRYSKFLWNVGVVFIPIESINLIDHVQTFSSRDYIFYFASGAVRFFPSPMTHEHSLKTLLSEVKKRIEKPGSKEKQAGSSDIPGQIRQLAELVKDGILTAAEFEAKKKELLERM